MCTSPLAAEHNGLIQERHKKQNQSLQTANARGEGEWEGMYWLWKKEETTNEIFPKEASLKVQSRFESIEDNGNQKFKAYFADGVCEWHQWCITTYERYSAICLMMFLCQKSGVDSI